MQRGYVLSRTAMWGSKFCTCIAIPDGEGGWTQIRPLINGDNYTPTATQYNANAINTHWWPGATVDLPDELDGSKARPTHPEDVWVSNNAITLYNTPPNMDRVREIAESLAVDTVEELYPDFQVSSGKAYMPEQPLAASVGYVRNARVLLTDDYAYIAEGDRTFKVALKGVLLRQRLDAGELSREWMNATVRLSLAAPWSGQAVHFDPRRCYMQLSDVIVA